MSATTAAIISTPCRIIPLPMRSPSNRQSIDLDALLRQLDAAQAAGEQDQAVALIAAIYARSDRARMSNTRDGATP